MAILLYCTRCQAPSTPVRSEILHIRNGIPLVGFSRAINLAKKITQRCCKQIQRSTFLRKIWEKATFICYRKPLFKIDCFAEFWNFLRVPSFDKSSPHCRFIHFLSSKIAVSRDTFNKCKGVGGGNFCPKVLRAISGYLS